MTSRILVSENLEAKAKEIVQTEFKSVHVRRELLDNSWYVFDCEEDEIEKTISQIMNLISGGIYK